MTERLSADDGKPPHMRRWTVNAVLIAAPGDQTSAYAEMDPRLSPFRTPSIANLRICGDGPAAAGAASGSPTKPPHMRRWTFHIRNHSIYRVQTSAYAEMDLRGHGVQRRITANLRICGDGPA